MKRAGVTLDDALGQGAAAASPVEQLEVFTLCGSIRLPLSTLPGDELLPAEVTVLAALHARSPCPIASTS